MSVNSKKAFVLVLLLATVFLAAQLHCCVDLNSRSLDSHTCPVCSTVGVAIVICFLILSVIPISQRFELCYSLPSLQHVILCSTTPRAPPLPA